MGGSRGGAMYKGGGMAPQKFEIFLNIYIYIYITILIFSNFSLQK